MPVCKQRPEAPDRWEAWFQLERQGMTRRKRSRIPFSGAAAAALVMALSGCAAPERGPKEAAAVGSPGYETSRSVSPGPERQERSIPELNESSTLDDLLRYAALNNPGLRAAFERWQATLERAPQVSALPDPRISYGYFIDEVETRVGPQRQRFGLSQTFPWFGTLGLEEKAALADAGTRREAFRAARLELFREVKDAYFEYAYVGRAIAVTRENVQLVASLESVAQTRYKVGSAPYASVVRAQVELGILEDRLQSLEDLLAPVAARLNAALNRPAGAPVPPPRPMAAEPAAISEEELRERLARGNPDLLALDLAAARDEAALDLAQKASYPDFTVGVDYIDTRHARMPGVHDSGKNPLIASVSMNLPFFSKRYEAAEREAEAGLRASLRQREDLENTLAAELKMVLFSFRDAGRKIDLYKDTLLPKANESLRVTQQAFEAGKADFLDLIDAQRVLLEFQLSLERALADRARSLAALEALCPGEEQQPPGMTEK